MTSSTKSQVLRYTLLSKDAINAEDMELYELVHLSGVVMDPNVFKIIVDLLRMNVTPVAIEKMLKNMVSTHYKKQSGADAETDNIAPSSGSSSVSSSSIPRSTYRQSAKDRPRSKYAN